jgi:hypothetical protein
MHHTSTRSAKIALLITSILNVAIAHGHGSPMPDFGPNVTILDPSMSVEEINATLQALATKSTGFDEIRNAVYFMPGKYGSESGKNDPTTATGFIDSPVGFMETVQGLGSTPDAVTINGNLRVGAATGSELGTFWRSLANVKINPIEMDEPAHTMRWNTSQACPVRRVDIVGNLDLSGGTAGGNLIANSRITGAVSAGFDWVTDTVTVPGQFYYYIHDSQIGNFQGHWDNYVFSGVEGAPRTQYNPGDVTTLPTTPISREAPFLYVDQNVFKVFVPDVRRNVVGFHWGVQDVKNDRDHHVPGVRDGASLTLDQFFIAKPTDTAATLNDALWRGKNLILTPGVYKVTEAIHVVRPNTIIMGMGLATVTPIKGTSAIEVDDVPGVSISAITVDANTVNSPVLVRVGTPYGGHHYERNDHEEGHLNPTTLSDVFVRVGGSYAGHATTSFEINQDNALIDHTWLWRADHGNQGTTGWTVNTGDHGLVVNGDNLTALGLFVEHYQKTQIVWNGNGGRTIFLQSEAPYDVPSQADYMNGSENGFPFYEVADRVTSHEASGLTAMTLFFMAKTPIFIHSAFKTPVTPHIHFHDIMAGIILGTGGVQNVINESGGSALEGGPSIIQLGTTTQVTSFP